jgi:predicted nucleic acid-binding protein
VNALLEAHGDSNKLLQTEALCAPHLIDLEVAHAFRAMTLRGRLEAGIPRTALGIWAQVGMTRLPVHGLLGRIWQLRNNLSIYDASYVAVAESLGCTLATSDVRLANAPGPTCPITVLRN